MKREFINVAEAVINMSESLLRLVKAIKNAKLAINDALRIQYKTVGYPFGESEEGLLLWREKLAKDYAVSHGQDVPAETPATICGANHKDDGKISDHFSALEEEVLKRVN